MVPYDAGTDSGVTHDSANVVTMPPVPIQLFSGFPLENRGVVLPMGPYEIERIDLARCDLELSQPSYVDGDMLIAQELRRVNIGTGPATVELKLYVEFPGGSDIASVVNEGADGSVVLPAGLDQDIGP